jgi:hypothetical protein
MLVEVSKCGALSFIFGSKIMFCRTLGFHKDVSVAVWALNTNSSTAELTCLFVLEVEI